MSACPIGIPDWVWKATNMDPGAVDVFGLSEVWANYIHKQNFRVALSYIITLSFSLPRSDIMLDLKHDVYPIAFLSGVPEEHIDLLLNVCVTYFNKQISDEGRDIMTQEVEFL